MSFLRRHLPPTLHNAIGTIIGALVLLGLGASAAFVPQLRSVISSLLSLAVPLWVCLSLLAATAITALVLWRRRRKAAAATIVQLAADVERLTRERDDAIEGKTRATFRLQELSKRLGDVVTIRPASGAERTRGHDR